jgi:hypothetical protein
MILMERGFIEGDAKRRREKFQEAVIAAEFSFREITTTKRR